MAFGTITVRSESGDHQEYELNKPTTSVGRQPGNDIVLNTTTVSRYHAQFEVAEGRVFVIDLETSNGTFVNDEPIRPNSPVALENGDVITLGDMMLTFTQPDAPQRTEINLTPDVTLSEAENVPFRLLLDKPRQLVAPGARIKLVLIIENMTDTEQTLEIAIGGMTRQWARTNWREILLMGHDQAEVTIEVLPPRSSETRPGRYPLTVRVSLKDDPNTVLEVVREIDVVGYSGLALVATPGLQQGMYHVAAQNQGNIPLTIEFRGFDRQHMLDYHFRPGHMEISPGQTGQGMLRVRPRRRPTPGQTRQVSFAVVAHSRDAAGYQAPVSLSYDFGAGSGGLVGLALGGASMLALGGMILVVVLVAAAYLFNLWPFNRQIAATEEPTVTVQQTPPTIVPTNTPESATDTPEATLATPGVTTAPLPQITQFVAVPENAVHGTEGTILFTWEVQNAGIVRLYYGTELLDEAEDAEGSLAFPVEDLVLGDNIFTLVAGDQASVSKVVNTWVQCRLIQFRPPGADVLDRPVGSPHPDFDELPSPNLIVTARVPDAIWNQASDPHWVEVAPGIESLDIRGWVLYEYLTCPSGTDPLRDFEQKMPPPAG